MGVVMLVPLAFGILNKPSEVKREPWLPPLNPRIRTDVPTQEYKKPTKGLHDWEEGRKLHTHEWDEFLEDIENRGLDPWDPEAIEIWDSNYN